MFTGAVAIATLATFMEGSRRFWDRPFDVLEWMTLALVAASAWAGLVCHLLRNKVTLVETPGRMVTWTVSLAVLAGLFAYWQFAGDKPEYLLRKTVIQRPTDSNAWLDLARHYRYERDSLAADLGDEDHSPPDPTASYQEALDCFNHAVHLGATGFEVQLAGAQLADAVGEMQTSVSFARAALRFAPLPVSGADRSDDIKWLREMIARNDVAPSGLQGQDANKLRVRRRRRQRLPGIVRWAFDSIEDTPEIDNQ
jgi:hypothetical protein